MNNAERWAILRRAEAGQSISTDPEQQILSLTADVERLSRLVKRPGLSPECRRLMRQTAERRLDEAGAIKHGKRYTPTGSRGIREVRTFSAVYEITEE